MSQKDFTICAGGGDVLLCASLRICRNLLMCGAAVEVLCFVGIQGYSQGADLTARGVEGCAVYTWVIASILPDQTPTVTHQ